MRSLVLLVTLLLVGCSMFGGESAQKQCERAVAADPKVVNLELKQNYRYAFQPDLSPEIAVARRQALLRCLRDKGLAAPGGVEPVTPRVPSLF